MLAFVADELNQFVSRVSPSITCSRREPLLSTLRLTLKLPIPCGRSASFPPIVRIIAQFTSCRIAGCRRSMRRSWSVSGSVAAVVPLSAGNTGMQVLFSLESASSHHGRCTWRWRGWWFSSSRGLGRSLLNSRALNGHTDHSTSSTALADIVHEAERRGDPSIGSSRPAATLEYPPRCFNNFGIRALKMTYSAYRASESTTRYGNVPMRSKSSTP